MSINPDGDMGGPDYSDYRFETFHLEPKVEGDSQVDFNFSWDPLQETGGLKNNEVAEITYLEIQAASEPESVGTAGDTIETRGVLGANLNFSDLHVAGANNANLETQVNSGTQDTGGTNEIKSENSIFATFQAQGSGNTTEAGGGSAVTQVERDYRSLTGRGPVVDQTDKIHTVCRVITDDSSAFANGQIRGHLIYDVAELSDAGRQFSVP